jgi:hypothetical protein
MLRLKKTHKIHRLQMDMPIPATYGMLMNSYTRHPHPPPPVWGQLVPLRTIRQSGPKVGQSGLVVVGHVLRDEPPKPVLGTTNVLGLFSSKC